MTWAGIRDPHTLAIIGIVAGAAAGSLAAALKGTMKYGAEEIAKAAGAPQWLVSVAAMSMGMVNGGNRDPEPTELQAATAASTPDTSAGSFMSVESTTWAPTGAGPRWEYHVASGDLWYFPDGSAGTYVGTGYSGAGEGLNNPLYQLERNVGPVPEGSCAIGSMANHTTGSGTYLPDSMILTPNAGTDLYGRSGFMIHGGNFQTYGSSQGCVVLPPTVRAAIGTSSVHTLQVVR